MTARPDSAARTAVGQVGAVDSLDPAPHLPEPRDQAAPYGVVMVCTGNICRSAMAHAVLVDRLAAAAVPTTGPGGVVVTSAGVSDEETGNPMDPRARRILAEGGYGIGADAAARAVAAVINAHAAHRISDAELRSADLVLAMTTAHLRALLRRAERLGVDPGRIRMFREFDPEAATTTPAGGTAPGAPAYPADRADLDVPDPWYGTVADFVDTLDVVERVSDALAPALTQLTGTPGATP
ncbi:protein-tyrosine phosphatase [Actinomyces ruminicola]|uniref:protein-tyrosine-phosphatase n=1 Tax=Actinomyces ruminicola TaxID=332524 RepID=A0A1G9Z6R5_9ACTO|nr:low molecular weight protein-tyrosine-phosphatase [Actinomyces ruminicola]SDN16755.1 protein-tyrosine phosphatase [Actinomyces ruminicola]